MGKSGQYIGNGVVIGGGGYCEGGDRGSIEGLFFVDVMGWMEEGIKTEEEETVTVRAVAVKICNAFHRYTCYSNIIVIAGSRLCKSICISFKHAHVNKIEMLRFEHTMC